MPSTAIKYFAFAHLPEHLQAISRPIGELAQHFEAALHDGPEKSAGMRKLLEAKDCFVRAALETQPPLAAPDESLLSLLRESAETFRRYEALHRAKGTAESDAKAEANAAIAGKIEAAIGFRR